MHFLSKFKIFQKRKKMTRKLNHISSSLQICELPYSTDLSSFVGGKREIDIHNMYYTINIQIRKTTSSIRSVKIRLSHPTSMDTPLIQKQIFPIPKVQILHLSPPPTLLQRVIVLFSYEIYFSFSHSQS